MSMKNEISFWPSRFASLRDTVPVPTTWGDLVEEIRGGRHVTVNRLYRETCARLAEAEAAGDIASVEELKRRKVSLKTSQAAFVCSVTLEGGRSQQHVRGYSDKAMVDIDDLNGKSLDTLVARVKADPHTFLAYVTLSGRGLRVVARVEPAPTDARTFARAWQTVNDYYARLLGVKVDAQCKNATRMSVLCHDPEVCYRPEAEALVVEPEAPARPRASRGRPVRAVSAAPTVRRLVEDDGILYAPGSHNAYICRCLYWMNRFGVSEADAEAWALSEFADYDAAEHSVAATVRSCYALTAEHATCRLARYARARTSKDKSGGGGSRAPRVSVGQMEDFIGRGGGAPLAADDRRAGELPVARHAARGAGRRPLPPAHAAAERLCAHVPPPAPLSRHAAALGWHDRLHRPPGPDGGVPRHVDRRVRLLLPSLAGGHAGRRAGRRRGEPRNPRPPRSARLVQELLPGEPAAALPAPLLHHEDQFAAPHQGRPLHHDREPARQLRGDRLHAASRAEPAEGHDHHALHQRASGLRAQQGAAAPCGLVLRHGQQPPVPHRRHRQPPLAALRGGAH